MAETKYIPKLGSKIKINIKSVYSRIPACYESGVTLFCLSENTPTVKKLLSVEDLPRKSSSCSSSS